MAAVLLHDHGVHLPADVGVGARLLGAVAGGTKDRLLLGLHGAGAVQLRQRHPLPRLRHPRPAHGLRVRPGPISFLGR